MKLCANQVNEFLSGIQFIEKDSGKCRSSCYGVLFLYSSDLHAHVLCLDNNSYT
jgi:hypothetical protein